LLQTKQVIFISITAPSFTLLDAIGEVDMQQNKYYYSEPTLSSYIVLERTNFRRAFITKNNP